MLKPNFSPHTLLLLALIATICLAQTPPESALPIEVQRQDGRFYFVTHPGLSGFRVALYDRNGSLRAESAAMTNPPRRWLVSELEPGVYLCVFWLRGQGGAEKQLARLEVQPTTMKLQAAKQYLTEVMPSDSVVWGTPEYRAIERRAKERGIAAIPFFRTATKVLPEESAAWLLRVQAIQLKYARFGMELLAPPPPPPVFSPSRTGSKTPRRKKAEPIVEFTLPQPTPAEKQEMLAAGQKAVAVAKSCPEKTNALRWLAAIQAELDRTDDQLATLEQIALASCAPNEIKAQSWYNIGVLCWDCAYQLTTQYANIKLLLRDPFHYRNFTDAVDQRKFEGCLQRGLTALEKALALNPEFANAWSYRSLLYREQQKTAASPAEQQKFAEAAAAAAERAIERTQKQRTP